MKLENVTLVMDNDEEVTISFEVEGKPFTLSMSYGSDDADLKSNNCEFDMGFDCVQYAFMWLVKHFTEDKHDC